MEPALQDSQLKHNPLGFLLHKAQSAMVIGYVMLHEAEKL